MNLIQKIKLLLKINSAYENVTGIIKGDKMDWKSALKSKTVWSIVISAAVGICEQIAPNVLSTPIVTSIISIMTVLGLYGRAVAEKPLVDK